MWLVGGRSYCDKNDANESIGGHASNKTGGNPEELVDKFIISKVCEDPICKQDEESDGGEEEKEKGRGELRIAPWQAVEESDLGWKFRINKKKVSDLEKKCDGGSGQE